MARTCSVSTMFQLFLSHKNVSTNTDTPMTTYAMHNVTTGAMVMAHKRGYFIHIGFILL